MPSTDRPADSRILFVYYKVDLVHEAAMMAAVQAGLADVERAIGMRGRLMRRTDDPATWMEVYDPVPDLELLERALAASVERHGLERFLKAGTRRMAEKFQPHG